MSNFTFLRLHEKFAGLGYCVNLEDTIWGQSKYPSVNHDLAFTLYTRKCINSKLTLNRRYRCVARTERDI